MGKSNEATLIKSNISKYLAVQFPCPKCGNIAGITLDMIHKKQWVECPKCNNKMAPFITSDKLTNFIKSYDSLHEQLQKIGLPIFFLHEQLPKIWPQKDK